MARAKVRVMRDVPGELHASGTVLPSRVNLIINAGSAVMRVEPADLVNAPDGLYKLRYVFNGSPEIKSVRVERGDILGNN